MLIRAVDVDDDPQRRRAFLVSQGFGHFVAGGVGHATPIVVPTQFFVSDDAILLHLAVDNPVFDRLAESPTAVMSVAGDWAYIPGTWKATGDEDPSLGIPTTYYSAVQVTGDAEVLDDPVDVAALLRLQLGGLEPEGSLADPADHGPKLRAINGIRLPLDDIRAKYKYGGNVDTAHRQAVATRLAERGGPGDRAASRQIPGI